MSIDIKGPQIYFTVLGIDITETIFNMWLIIIIVFLVCKILTRGLKTRDISKKQIIAELIVTKFQEFVTGNMGSSFISFSPFIGALFLLSLLSSLLSVFGLFSPTADLSVTFGWSILVFIMIIYTKIKTNGLGGYLKGFAQPIAVLTPFNIIGEIATPVSMAFRHFGNIASGTVIMSLLYGALAAASSLLPGALSKIPIFQIGIPAVFSVYFDVFSSVLQAYIFCMLTTMYLATAGEKE